MKNILTIMLIYLLHMNNALSSAWIIPKGKTQLIIQNWNIKSNLHGNRYGGNDTPIYLNTSSISTYIEHGITNRISIGSNSLASWKMVEDKRDGNDSSKKLLEFVEIFTKINILKTDYFVFSNQTLISIPGYNEYTLHSTQSPILPNKAYETRLMFGFGAGQGSLMSGILGGDGSFINFEIAYRKNENFMAYNEIRSQLDMGYKINDETIKMLLFQFFKTNKMYKYFTDTTIWQQNGYMKNDINQFLGSIMLDIGSNTLIQFGLFYEISGNIIGPNQEGNKAKGIVFGLWM